jgi:hypothetical protein
VPNARRDRARNGAQPLPNTTSRNTTSTQRDPSHDEPPRPTRSRGPTAAQQRAAREAQMQQGLQAMINQNAQLQATVQQLLTVNRQPVMPSQNWPASQQYLPPASQQYLPPASQQQYMGMPPPPSQQQHHQPPHHQFPHSQMVTHPPRIEPQNVQHTVYHQQTVPSSQPARRVTGAQQWGEQVMRFN